MPRIERIQECAGFMQDRGFFSCAIQHAHKQIVCIAIATSHQKHKIEIEYAKAACEQLGIAHAIVNLDLQKLLAGSALVGDSDIPEGNYDKEKMKRINIVRQHRNDKKSNNKHCSENYEI